MPEQQCDVALSFAGEDRDHARGVADALQGKNVKLFFDEFESIGLWGKDLAVEFSAIYGERATFVVPLVSRSYAGKAWPRHEFRSALATAIEAEGERILPVRLDDTELPGLRGTIAYLDGRKLSPRAVADAILQKLRKSPSAPRADSAPSSGRAAVDVESDVGYYHTWTGFTLRLPHAHLPIVCATLERAARVDSP